MGRTIFDKTQIIPGLLDDKKVDDLRDFASDIDELSYQAAPNQKFFLDGSFALNSISNGGFQLSSGAVAGNRDMMSTATTAFVIDESKDYEVYWIGGAGDLTDHHLYFGAAGALPTAAAPPVQPAEAAYFRAQAAGGAVNWFAVSRAGAVETAVDTGKVLDGNVHHFRIRKRAGVVEFFYDGVSVAKIVTNVAQSGAGMLVFGGGVTQAAVAKASAFGAMAWFAKRF